MAFLKKNTGKNENRRFQLPAYDRSKLPAQRFIKMLAENEFNPKYLGLWEVLLFAALGVSIYFYYFA